MEIKCKECGFKIHTSGEGFSYPAPSINFCMDCGQNYFKNGVDTRKLLGANRIASAYRTRTSMLYGFIPVILCLAVMGWLVFKNIVTITQENFASAMILSIGMPMAYFIFVMLVVGSKSNKIFKDLSGT